MALHGTSKAYIVDRLKREGETALLAAVETGKISALTAAVSLGWVKRPKTLGGSTHRAHRRDFQLRAINGGTGLSQLQELWLGPNSSHGSLFDSREELQTAWEQNRAEVMRLWGSHGRRPMAWWEFDAGDLKHPGYDLERSTLWRAGLLTEAEKTELEHEWRAEFEKAWAPDFMLNVDGRELLTGIRARAAHLRWADVPHELVAAWTAERKHREQPASPEEVAAGAAHAGAAPEA